ncbi:prepilin-type N-terminal cleavage/methylation domain-containing protein [Opitutaceae bacterium TAV4]|nr:prepilin-type N-terminal cleavage/methylation domain-containing protein [Opitutaceae bacterium TAV4]RRJ99917.1 prepilin-type N-terminal cleavage/methylation domain-containing protein [Opitutaceae bacterium TAV3]
MHSRHSPRHVSRECDSAAFTLIELLTVIAIIGILAAIIIPTVGRVRTQARLVQTISNLRQTGITIMLSTDDHRGELPGRNSGDGSGQPIGVGNKGLQTSVKSTYYNSEVDKLPTHLAPYVQTSGAQGGIQRRVPCLEDPLAASKRTGDTEWVLNRQIKKSNYPDTSRDLTPFGLIGDVAPERYETLTSSLTISRVWALIQADQKIPADASLISDGSVKDTPLEPVAGKHRHALFFDWSVGKIPVGTNLNKQIDNRQ